MIFNKIIQRTPIQKGWSGDKKFQAITKDGDTFLLRISDISIYEKRQRQFSHMQQLHTLGIPMCQPLEFGRCSEGVYSIQSWIHGEDAEPKIPTIDGSSQYRYGVEAGQILKIIHTLPAPVDAPEWEDRFNRKIDRKIAMYHACPLKYESGAENFLRYIQENRHMLHGRPQCYQHGDYHVGNMMIDKQGNLSIIDFDREDYGDPWEEFNRIVWCAMTAPAFASGMVDGYFHGNVPMEFWKLLALYISSNTLSSLPWAVSIGEAEINVMQNQAKQVLAWFDNMNCVIPTWYQSMWSNHT